MLFENSKQVKLSEVELDPVSGNELKVIFVPQKDYEEERRIFNENYPDGESEFDVFYEILFSAYVTHEGQPGVLLFMYNTDGASASKESSPTTELMKLMSGSDEINFFERDIYDQEAIKEESVPAGPYFLLMWLAAGLIADGMNPRDVFDMGLTRYKGDHCPYNKCNPNWFNWPVNLTIATNYDLLDAIKDWLK
ncbi:MAG: hypothetical protein II162_02590, partial [Clostridia bacterium]|nr:hypothetical protein [Clostridia bacterium]